MSLKFSRFISRKWDIRFKLTNQHFSLERFHLYKFKTKNNKEIISCVENVDNKLIWLYDFKHHKFTQIRIRDVVDIKLVKECEPMEHISNRERKRIEKLNLLSKTFN